MGGRGGHRLPLPRSAPPCAGAAVSAFAFGTHTLRGLWCLSEQPPLLATGDPLLAAMVPTAPRVVSGALALTPPSVRPAGMPNTSGLVNRRNVIATSDATVVSRLKQAGAIPLGVTNCSELCMWYESSNRVYGRTNNPYDLQRIVGGSSGEPRLLTTVLHQPRVKRQPGTSSQVPCVLL